MRKQPLPFAIPNSSVSLADLRRYGEGWLLSCDIARHSKATIENRRLYLSKLQWFLEEKSCSECDTVELRQFFAYLNHGHKEPGGRWGNPQLTKPVKPGTVATYDQHLRTFFTWLVSEEVISRSPMEKIPEPTNRPDQIEPFTDAEIERLISAAKKSIYPKRDEAIIWFMLDTGIRASELCDLRMENIDLAAHRAKIEDGKGGKSRSVWFGNATAKALWNYLKVEPHDEIDPLFFNHRGDSLTRSGLGQLIERLSEKAGISHVRSSPHTFRHSFAISFLRSGGDLLTLQQLLGHSSLAMVQRYVKLAQADLQNAHRRFSPGDRLRSRRASS